MNKLEYVNKLLEADDISEYIKKIEETNSISPPSDLKNKILLKCYNTQNDSNKKNIKHKVHFIDIIKVACFALVITLCTEVFMNATYASTKSNLTMKRNYNTIYKICNKIDNTMQDFSNFMLNCNLKGE